MLSNTTKPILPPSLLFDFCNLVASMVGSVTSTSSVNSSELRTKRVSILERTLSLVDGSDNVKVGNRAFFSYCCTSAICLSR
mmetsp:Transcript_2785/g.3801  ORF Transcript_2785/g.3801 Transcript_2785/m.3801 type:complete len:82 (+) Transcript_2785:757-1002(+)